jgi:hypothetical protein
MQRLMQQIHTIADFRLVAFCTWVQTMLGLDCVGSWTDQANTCTPAGENNGCDTPISSSDDICECAVRVPPVPAPSPKPLLPPWVSRSARRTVIPYAWYMYNNYHTIPAPAPREFLTAADAEIEFIEPLSAGADGVFVWGAVEENAGETTNSSHNNAPLQQYVYDVLERVAATASAMSAPATCDEVTYRSQIRHTCTPLRDQCLTNITSSVGFDARQSILCGHSNSCWQFSRCVEEALNQAKCANSELANGINHMQRACATLQGGHFPPTCKANLVAHAPCTTGL